MQTIASPNTDTTTDTVPMQTEFLLLELNAFHKPEVKMIPDASWLVERLAESYEHKRNNKTARRLRIPGASREGYQALTHFKYRVNHNENPEGLWTAPGFHFSCYVPSTLSSVKEFAVENVGITLAQLIEGVEWNDCIVSTDFHSFIAPLIERKGSGCEANTEAFSKGIVHMFNNPADYVLQVKGKGDRARAMFVLNTDS